MLAAHSVASVAGADSFWLDVKKTVTAAVILAILGGLWVHYIDSIEMRHDLDALYGYVNDVAQGE